MPIINRVLGKNVIQRPTKTDVNSSASQWVPERDTPASCVQATKFPRRFLESKGQTLEPSPTDKQAPASKYLGIDNPQNGAAQTLNARHPLVNSTVFYPIP